MIQDILALLLVAAAFVYMVLRLRRATAGQSKCACGSNACGPASGSCSGSLKDAPVSSGPDGGLPLLHPSCRQSRCGKS